MHIPILGGVVLKASHFGKSGKTEVLVHELGHVLGLWHTHHGVSEMDCLDPCLEVQPSLEVSMYYFFFTFTLETMNIGIICLRCDRSFKIIRKDFNSYAIT